MFHKLIKAIKKNFSLDVRSLALFRVALALILIIDFLFTRLPYFTLFYTDKGILPLRILFRDKSFWASSSSLNFISSSHGYQLVLGITALIFFFMLLVGYKTRWAVLGSWILVASFHSRNFLILNSGDILICLLLFWSLCLPLGKHFSLDSALMEKTKQVFSVFSVNSFSFIFQILLVYFFTYLMKSDNVWSTGQAVYYALMLDNFRTAWGDILLQYPYVMRVLSFITYNIIENFVPLLFVFFGFWWRFKVLLILVMCFFHLSLGTFLHLGLFSWVCIAGWLAFLPSEFWEHIKELLPAGKRKLFVYYDEDCTFCKKASRLIQTFLILPHVPFAPAQSDSRTWEEMQKRNSWLVFDGEDNWYSRWEAWVVLISRSPLFFYLAPLFRIKKLSALGDWCYGKVAENRKQLGYLLPNFQKERSQKKIFSILLTGFFFFSFVYVIMWNVRTLDFKYYSKYMPKEWNKFGAFFHLNQYWNMFSPKPLDKTGWIILSAVKSDTDEKIDLWRQGKPVSMKKPIRYDTSFPNFRFRKMLENFVLQYKKYSVNYLLYLCGEWNTKKSGRYIEKIEFIYMEQKIPSPERVTSPASNMEQKIPFSERLLPPKKVSIRKKRCPRQRG